MGSSCGCAFGAAGRYPVFVFVFLVFPLFFSRGFKRKPKGKLGAFLEKDTHRCSFRLVWLEIDGFHWFRLDSCLMYEGNPSIRPQGHLWTHPFGPGAAGPGRAFHGSGSPRRLGHAPAPLPVLWGARSLTAWCPFSGVLKFSTPTKTRLGRDSEGALPAEGGWTKERHPVVCGLEVLGNPGPLRNRFLLRQTHLGTSVGGGLKGLKSYI